MSVRIRGRGLSGGTGRGPILVSSEPISFLGGVDPETGTVIEKGHPLSGRSVSGAILVFPHGKGSTVGSYVLYALARNGRAPAGIVNAEAEPIIVVGAIIAGIPLIDHPGIPLTLLRDGVMAEVDGSTGEIGYEGELEGD
jgi:phosphomecalonate degydratase small subunit